MNLSDWVQSVGGKKKAAKILDVPARSLSSWLRFKRMPRLSTAGEIINQTKGAVDLNGIYGRFLVRDHGVCEALIPSAKGIK